MTDGDKLLLEITDGVALIRINDPASYNAISETMAVTFKRLLERAEQEARVVIITGTGKAFSSGANMGGPKKDMPREEVDVGLPLREYYNPLMTTIRNLSVPVITAVNGVAAGIGYSLAVSGDLILAAKSAKFVLAFSKMGLAPDGGVSYQLVKTMGRARAMELALMDKKLSAEAAVELGLINRAVDDEELMPAVMAIASELATGPTLAYNETRKLIWAAAESSYADLLALEAEGQKALGRSEDHGNAVKSFVAKTKPVFKGC